MVNISSAHLIGKTLSHYHITAELGRGGMGIVYKAEDTKLDRTVAIKVLPAAALASKTDKARFYREAKAAAALTHPHIAIIHSVDEAVPSGLTSDDLRPFIAMEYIDGETLEDRIEKAPLKLDEAVRITSEVASALQLAHEKEIVHRDVKSANVMLTSKNSAKVLDFGLAQTAASTKLTTLGSTVGTTAFMSPEQACGEEVDRRTDIFALGVILYQMISGSLPFGAEYQQAIIYSIINLDPEPLTTLRTGVPMELERIVDKCLEKDAARRYQHCDDLIADLQGIDAKLLTKGSGSRAAATAPNTAINKAPNTASGHSAGQTDPEPRTESVESQTAVVAAGPGASKSQHRKWLLSGFTAGAALATVAILIISGGEWPLRGNGGETNHAPGSDIVSMSRITIGSEIEMYPSIHPGGDRVVYTVGRPGRRHLFYKLLEGGRPIRLVDGWARDTSYPSYSPDGKSVLFESEGSIFTVEGLGGNPRTIIRPQRLGEAYRYPTWSPTGAAIAFASSADSIFVYKLGAGEPAFSAALYSPHSLSWSPDGKYIAVVSTNELQARSGTNVAPTSIWLIEAASGALHQITTTEFMDLSPKWEPDGSALYFVSNGGGAQDIYRQEISASGEPDGSPERVTVGLNLHSFDLSKDGTRFTASDLRYRQNIWASPLDGKGIASVTDAVPITTGAQVIEGVVISPDGKRIAYDSDIRGIQHIFVAQLTGGSTPLQLTFRNEPDYVYAWSPYGDFVTFHTFKNGSRDVSIVSVDDQIEEILSDDPRHERYAFWLSDANTMAYHRDAPGSLTFGAELVQVERNANGGWGRPEVMVKNVILGAKWSMANHMLVYAYRERSDQTIRVWDPGTKKSRIIPETTGKNASAPMWSQDGRTIYFRAATDSGEWSFWAVPVDGGPARIIVDLADVELGIGVPTVDKHRIYYTISEIEGDIWVLDRSTRVDSDQVDFDS